MDKLIAVARKTLERHAKNNGLDLGCLSENQVQRFMVLWIKARNRHNNIHPTMIKKMIYALTVVIDQILMPIPINIRAAIKRVANKEGEKLYKEKLILIKKATPHTLEEVFPLIQQLWRDHRMMYKQAAIVLAICYASGARCGEVLELRWEDIRTESTMIGEFLSIYVRAGKTNKLCSKNEQLTAVLGKDTLIQMDIWLGRWRKLTEGQVGRIFPYKPQGTSKMTTRWNRAAQKMNLPICLGGHSGRNHLVIKCFEAGVPIESMRSYFRWAVNSDMPSYYRSLHLETSKTGAANLLAQANFNKKTKPWVGQTSRTMEVPEVPAGWTF